MSRVFQSLTVRENLIIATAGIDGFGFRSFAGFGSDRQTARRVDALLDYWGLAAHSSTLVRALSYGVQRLLDIALAFAVDPRMVMLDEPTAGLSAGERELMTVRLNGLSREVTLLLTDHDMDVVFRVGDEITVLDRGQAIAQGSPEAIRRDAAVRDIYLGSF
jgi:branched-chain amino acid transport system ATP-binding protein